MNRGTAELFSDEAMGYTAPVAKGAALGYPEQQHGGFTDLLGARQEMGHDSLEEQRYLQMGGGGRKTRRAGGRRRRARKTQKSSRGGNHKSRSEGNRNTFRISFRGQIRLKQRHRQ
jgi:hypothetical protein